MFKVPPSQSEKRGKGSVWLGTARSPKRRGGALAQGKKAPHGKGFRGPSTCILSPEGQQSCMSSYLDNSSASFQARHTDPHARADTTVECLGLYYLSHASYSMVHIEKYIHAEAPDTPRECRRDTRSSVCGYLPCALLVPSCSEREGHSCQTSGKIIDGTADQFIPLSAARSGSSASRRCIAWRLCPVDGTVPHLS
jgi:hypothetical protein